MISRTMHGFDFDPVRDEIVVTSPLAQAILVFRGGAHGEEPPIRVIQGPHTQIQGDYPGTGANDRVSVDPVNGEYYLFSTPNQILVFDRAANGDVPPKRVLGGPNTRITGRSTSAVDPVHNILAVNTRESMLIFDRTANGNVKPKAAIEGPKSGMGNLGSFQIYAPKGEIIAGCGPAYASTLGICAWNITDNGDVAPRWRLPVQQLTGGYQASAIVLDPVHKEVMMSSSGQKIQVARPESGIMNAITTFYWPEIY